MSDTFYTDFTRLDGNITKLRNDQFAFIAHQGHMIPVLNKFIEFHNGQCQQQDFILYNGRSVTSTPECVGWHFCEYGLWEPVLAITVDEQSYIIIPVSEK